MVIQGYRVKGTDLDEIVRLLNRTKDAIRKETDKEYHALISKEVAFLADKTALNILTKDTEKSIFECAVENVDQRMNAAGTLNSDSSYNLRIYAYVMPYEGYTYIKVMCMNKKLLKAFKDFEDYSLNEIECEDKHNKKTATWEKIHGLYKDSEPLVISLTQNVTPDKDRLKFESVKKRAEKEARHSVMSKMLGAESAGREIPPYRLMDYLDDVIERFAGSDTAMEEYNLGVTKLMKILPDLNNTDFWR